MFSWEIDPVLGIVPRPGLGYRCSRPTNGERMNEWSAPHGGRRARAGRWNWTGYAESRQLSAPGRCVRIARCGPRRARRLVCMVRPRPSTPVNAMVLCRYGSRSRPSSRSGWWAMMSTRSRAAVGDGGTAPPIGRHDTAFYHREAMSTPMSAHVRAPYENPDFWSSGGSASISRRATGPVVASSPQRKVRCVPPNSLKGRCRHLARACYQG